jgi:hypothetical protein
MYIPRVAHDKDSGSTRDMNIKKDINTVLNSAYERDPSHASLRREVLDELL